MKKLLMLLVCTLMLSTSANAWKLVPFTLSFAGDDNISLGNGHPKSPIQPPTVYLDDYVLTFETDHPDYTLYIKDGDGEVVYTTTVYSAQTQVTLPSSLSGDYEIELVMGYWVFTGFISLF